MVQNNGSPDFPPFITDFWFEKRQNLKFVLHNVDKQCEMGQIDTTMSKVMGAKN